MGALMFVLEFLLIKLSILFGACTILVLYVKNRLDELFPPLEVEGSQLLETAQGSIPATVAEMKHISRSGNMTS